MKAKIIGYVASRYGLAGRQPARERLGDRDVLLVGGSILAPDHDHAWLLALGFHSRVVFDVGCNVGESSLLMLYGGSVREIVLVDANPAALSGAAANLIANRLVERARFVSAFVSRSSDDTMPFYTTGTGAAGSMYASHAVTAAAVGTVAYVPTTTIDDLSERFGLVPDLVKLDVEGAEHLALEGARALPGRRATRFVVEMHSNPELPMRENARRALEWCGRHDYRAWYLKEKTALTTPETIAHRGRCHLLLQPSEWPFPSYLAGIEQGADVNATLRDLEGSAAH